MGKRVCVGAGHGSVLTRVGSGNSPQVHCMCDSALSMLSEARTISSESLFGEKAWDRP